MPDVLETRVVRKLSWHILPFVMMLYFVSFLDRVNVGFAALSMNKAIGLTPAMFGLGGGIFFLGYSLFELPSNLILYRVGARLWIARVMVTWGIASAASAFAVGPHSFYVLRFLLGLAEAGFFPGIILYLSLWFPARYRAAAAAMFMAAAPISTAIGSPISGALMKLPTIAGLQNWQWLYVIEAVPAVVLGFVVLAVLKDKPAEAKWLQEDERRWLVNTLHEEASTVGNGANSHTHAWRAALNPYVVLLGLIYLGTSAGLYTIGIWTPLILQRFGYSSLIIGWLSAVPSVAAVVGMLLWAKHSDRSGERIWHVVLPCIAACLGFVWAARAQEVVPVIAALSLAGFGINAAKAPLWAIPPTFLSGASAAAGIACINSVGNLGGFIGPYVLGWSKSKWGSYTGGLYVVAATMAFSALLTALMGRQSAKIQPMPRVEQAFK